MRGKFVLHLLHCFCATKPARLDVARCLHHWRSPGLAGENATSKCNAAVLVGGALHTRLQISLKKIVALFIVSFVGPGSLNPTTVVKEATLPDQLLRERVAEAVHRGHPQGKWPGCYNAMSSSTHSCWMGQPGSTRWKSRRAGWKANCAVANHGDAYFQGQATKN